MSTVAIAISGARGEQGAQGAQGPQGSAGTSLLWDTVDYTVGDLAGGGELPYSRDVTITLKLGAVEVAEDTIVKIMLLQSDGISFSPLDSGISGSYTVSSPTDYFSYLTYCYYATGSGGITLQPYCSAATDLYLVVLKPNGGIEKILIDLTA